MLIPIFSKRLISTLNQIQKAKDTNKLVVFAGAGISKGSGVPLWGELAEEIKKKIEDPGDNYSNYDPLKLAELLYNELGTKLYNDFIREKLCYRQTSYNELHELILNLSPAHIITTNYDNHFEQVIDKYGLNYSVVRKDEDLSYADYPNMLIKMHGDFDELNMVLKEEDYLNYSNNFTLIEGFIRGLFTTHTVLFLGYSFSDLDLKIILTNLRRILGSHISPSYIFFPDSKPSKELKYLEQKGILSITNDLLSFVKVENVESRGYSSTSHNFDNAQSHISPWKQILTKNKIISSFERQAETSAFLKFLTDYNDFNFECENYSIFSKINKSIERYSTLTTFPKEVICQIYPLNKDSYKAFTNKDTLYICDIEFEQLWSQIIEANSLKSTNENNKFFFWYDFEGFKKTLTENYYDEETLNEIYSCLYSLNKSGISKISINDSTKIIIFVNPISISIIDKPNNRWFLKYYTLDLVYLFNQIKANKIVTKIDVSTKEKIRELTELVHVMKFLNFENEAEILANQISILLKKRKDFFSYFIIQLLRTEFIQGGQNRNYKDSIFWIKNNQNIDIDRLCELLPVDLDTRTVMRSLKKLSFIEELMDNLFFYKNYLKDSINEKEDSELPEEISPSFILTLTQDIHALFDLSNVSYIGHSYFNSILIEILEIYFLMSSPNFKGSIELKKLFFTGMIFPIVKHMKTKDLYLLLKKNSFAIIESGGEAVIKFHMHLLKNLLSVVEAKNYDEVINKLGEEKIFSYLNNAILITNVIDLSESNAKTLVKQLGFLTQNKKKFTYLNLEILDFMISNLQTRFPKVIIDDINEEI